MPCSTEELELATGLKEVLLSNGFYTLNSLLDTTTEELARALGIDSYVAKIIHLAAKQHNEKILKQEEKQLVVPLP